MKTLLLISAALLGLSAGPSFGGSLNGAGGSSLGGAPPVGRTIVTPGGAGVTAGNVGGMQTTTLPGGAGLGLLMNNGNGTSTLTGPGVITTVPTPR